MSRARLSSRNTRVGVLAEFQQPAESAQLLSDPN